MRKNDTGNLIDTECKHGMGNVPKTFFSIQFYEFHACLLFWFAHAYCCTRYNLVLHRLPMSRARYVQMKIINNEKKVISSIISFAVESHYLQSNIKE